MAAPELEPGGSPRAVGAGWSDHYRFTSQAVGKDNIFGIKFEEFVAYLPTRVGPHPHIDMVAFFEAFRHRCAHCDRKFLEMLMKPVPGVACVKAKLFLPNNCPSGSDCQRRFNRNGRTTPGYQMLLSRCGACHAYEEDRQEFTLIEVFLPIRIDKYMHEFMFTKAGRREMQCTPQTACMTREISYTEPKLKRAFSEDQQILYERAILMWMPTILMSECLSNKVLENAQDKYLGVVSRAWRDFWYGREKITGATHWEPHYNESIRIKGMKKKKAELCDSELAESTIAESENSDGKVYWNQGDEQPYMKKVDSAIELVPLRQDENENRLMRMTEHIRNVVAQRDEGAINALIEDIDTVVFLPELNEAQRRKIARDRSARTSRTVPPPPARVIDPQARLFAPTITPRYIPPPPPPPPPPLPPPPDTPRKTYDYYDCAWWELPSSINNYVYRVDDADHYENVEFTKPVGPDFPEAAPENPGANANGETTAAAKRFARKRELKKLVAKLEEVFDEFEEDRTDKTLKSLIPVYEELLEKGGDQLRQVKFVQMVLEQHGIRDKIARDQIRATKDYEEAIGREDAGGIAGVSPAPCGRPEDWENTHPAKLKEKPQKGENRSGTTKMLSAREKIMLKHITKVRTALKRKKIECIPAWFQVYIDEFEDPNRVPDYILMQQREQFLEKCERAEGNDGKTSKSANLVGPMNEELNVGYTRGTHIVNSANARMTGEGTRVVTATDDMLEHTFKTAKALVEEVLPPKELRHLWIESGGFENAEWKPSTWEEKKYFDEIGSWKEGGNLRHMDLFVKFCQMKKGKTQRLISNEGGMRQVSRSFISKLAEMLEGKAHTAHNTKHKTKSAVNALLFKNTKKLWTNTKSGVFVEGDGKAWDSSCGRHVRWAIEQVVEQHIVEALGPLLHGLGKEDLDHRFKRCYGDDPMKWRYSEHGSMFDAIFMVTTDFIMRSTGDAMTSFLNRFVNMVLWTNALTNEIRVVKNFKRPIVHYKCRWSGKKDARPIIRQFYFIYEGDDSGLKLERELLKYRHKIEAFWKAWGFNMEIKWIWDSDPMVIQPAGCTCDLATFCGWKYVVSQGGITRTCAPDLSRALAAEVSSSQCSNQSIAGRDTVGKAYSEARAQQFLDTFAGLSETYTQQANYYKDALAWKKKKPKMDKKTQMEMSYIATGVAWQFDGEYIEAMETSFQHTQIHELRLLRLHQGVTDWDFYQWEGAAQSSHRTTPGEAYALGRRINRPRVQDPQIEEARKPRKVLGEDEPYPKDPYVQVCDEGHKPDDYGSEFSSDEAGDGPPTSKKKKANMQLLPAEVKKKISAFLKPLPPTPPPDDWGGPVVVAALRDWAEVRTHETDFGRDARIARYRHIMQEREITDSDFDEGIGLDMIRALDGAARMRAWHEANADWLLEWAQTGVNRRAPAGEQAVQHAMFVQNRALTRGERAILNNRANWLVNVNRVGYADPQE